MIMAAPIAVAIAVDGAGSTMSGFDAGRAAQNIMLAAWDEGVASCPNGIADAEWAAEVLSLDEAPALVLTFGYPAKHPGAESRSAEEWSARADRKPLDEIVSRI